MSCETIRASDDKTVIEWPYNVCDGTTAALLVMRKGGLAIGSIVLSSRYVTSATDGSHEARFHLHFQDSLIITFTIDFAHFKCPELRSSVIKNCSELWQTVSACELRGISSESAIHTRDSKTLDVTNAAPSHQAQVVTQHNESRISWPQLLPMNVSSVVLLNGTVVALLTTSAQVLLK